MTRVAELGWDDWVVVEEGCKTLESDLAMLEGSSAIPFAIAASCWFV
jgi:glycine cleavage system regulatory protein